MKGNQGQQVIGFRTYNKYIGYLKNYYNVPSGDRTNTTNNVKQRYYLGGNSQSSLLYRKGEGNGKGVDGATGRKVATCKGVFDIIDEAHLHLAHAKGSCTMYNFIGKVWHGITEKVIKENKEATLKYELQKK